MTTKNVIADAVEFIKSHAVERAADQADRMSERYYTDLARHNGDINAAFPYPYGANRMARGEYEMAKARRHVAEMLTVRDESRKSGYGLNDPYYVVRDDARQNNFIETARLDAAMQYDAYVCKLINKVEKYGPVEHAEVTEFTSVWDHSILTCRHADGRISKWKTKQIINVSKLGKLFNQWPTHETK